MGGGRFSRFDWDARCYILLQKDAGKGQRYGPFRGFSGMNGLKYVDHRLFCLYDEQHQNYYGYESGEHWDSVTVLMA